jgi:predicted NAD-dependent protein-ADP-ribosyltransferase YbiA (DUF1768 family)
MAAHSSSCILFKSWKENGYAWLSNFYPYVKAATSVSSPSFTLVIDGVSYLSVEHYFQGMR